MREHVMPLIRGLLPWTGAAVGALYGIGAALTVASNGIAVLPVLVVAVAIAAGIRRPVASMALVAAGSAIAAWLSMSGMWAVGLGLTALGTAIAVGLVSARSSGPRRWWALATALGSGVLVGVPFGVATGPGVSTLLLILLQLLGWAVGVAVAEALRRLAALRTAAELGSRLEHSEHELSISDERNRIARELHDVVAHSLAVILAQAQGARALEVKRPAAMADALDAISESARTALLDVRGVIDGMVDGIEPPQPDLTRVDELIDRVRAAGLQVRAVSAGEQRELGPGQQAAAYRILQEGTTNAIRHRGRGSEVDLVLDWRGPGLSIQLVSSGGEEVAADPGTGRGITGMEERAAAAGGWLAAGADATGAHRITAFIPYREVEAGVPA